MKGIEKQIVKIITDLGEADSESIARRIGVSAGYTEKICEGLLKDDYLVVADGKYRVTSRAEKVVNPVKVRGMISVLKGGV
jgi:Mn-dependent DtxR family transcriptional regulator